MAGAGYKLFNTGDVLTAAQVNTYLMEQTVMVFANAAARTTALSGVVSEGMISYLKDTNAVEVYDGSNWVSSDDPNAIQNTIVDAKGDLITATAADTPARLAVGTNGYKLEAASGESTGLKWTPSYGSTISVQRGTSNQTITAGAWTKIQLNSEDLDTDGSYDPTTNYRFTPKVAGYYQFNTMIYCQANAAESNIAIYKNGGFYALVELFTSPAGPKGRPTIISANGTTDYFEWYLYSNTNSTVVENRAGGCPTTVTWLRGL